MANGKSKACWIIRTDARRRTSDCWTAFSLWVLDARPVHDARGRLRKNALGPVASSASLYTPVPRKRTQPGVQTGDAFLLRGRARCFVSANRDLLGLEQHLGNF